LAANSQEELEQFTQSLESQVSCSCGAGSANVVLLVIHVLEAKVRAAAALVAKILAVAALAGKTKATTALA
jgi:hypothetical protein